MQKIKYVMVGVCSNCGKEHLREFPVDTAVCPCQNKPIILELMPALILPKRVYNKIERLAKTIGVNVEAIVNAVLEKAVEDYERRKIAVSI